MSATPVDDVDDTQDERLSLPSEMTALLAVLPLGWAAQLIATDLSALRAAAGVMALGLIAVIGILLTRALPFLRLPSVAWVSLVGIVASLPMLPWGEAVVGVVGDIDFLALSVPCLAFAGLAISRREVAIARTSGWKLLVVGVLVLVGTFIGSALIADVTLPLLD
ncbi:hypothetical protein WDV85_04410 [Pseudokineococcus sp. 5B2Z-1]|uniref:hypothetical protein n=1 Tax=Pseudokineococcus sp. 5B2Z-1 TaxID=3132744 RepID=UPI00309487CC